MRKINKNCDLSTVYKSWEKDLEDKNEPHPKYNSSEGEYYADIIMQLYRCQQGLCAYTERFLCKSSHFAVEQWKAGRYESAVPHTDRHGSLDHFDPNLKSGKRDLIGKKDWLWDNFFMIDFETNSTVVKGRKVVDPILKPDSPGYDPFDLLDYDPSEHVFFPRQDLQDESKKNRIDKMLSVLGINHIPQTRRSYLRRLFTQIFSGQSTWEELEGDIDQFPTAFAMCKLKVEKGEVNLEDLITI